MSGSIKFYLWDRLHLVYIEAVAGLMKLIWRISWIGLDVSAEYLVNSYIVFGPIREFTRKDCLLIVQTKYNQGL